VRNSVLQLATYNRGVLLAATGVSSSKHGVDFVIRQFPNSADADVLGRSQGSSCPPRKTAPLLLAG
jgi:hypothetical protein